MKVPYFIPWITNDDKKAVLQSLNSRWLTNGPILGQFEKRFSKFIGCKNSIGVSSGTHALHLSLHATDIGPGDEVIVPVMTFSATADAIIYTGAKPVLADIQPDTFNISINDVKKKINKRTKAIIAVHYGGQSCDMYELQNICKDKGLFLIEDCAHALGSCYNNKKCGSIGLSGCFSFYPTKIITTGEGGMVTTNNKKITKRIQLLRSHGMTISPKKREEKRKWKYDILETGYNYRLDEIRSALGLSQLKRIEIINKKRIRLAKKYSRRLQNIKGISIPVQKEDRNHIFHLYAIKVEKDYHLTRDELFNKLASKGIGSSVQYLPLNLMTHMKKRIKVAPSNFPIANKVKDQILCLPIFPSMTTKQIEYIINTIEQKHN